HQPAIDIKYGGGTGSEHGPEISANRKEGDITEIQQAGKAHDNIEAQGQSRKNTDLDDQFQVRTVVKANQRYSYAQYKKDQKDLEARIQRRGNDNERYKDKKRKGDHI